MYSYEKTLERTAGVIRNGTIIDIEHKKQKEDSKKDNTEN